MAEVKNSFLKSKMNQDLDDRLLPNGEYRSASNISVGKSETDDIGTLQNILGNEKLPLTDYNNPDLECIGAFMDNQNNCIYQFLTDYYDNEPNNITPPTSGTMMITMYNLAGAGTYSVLVEGLFLNFAKNKEFKITGVNLIEGLLFWTDNRNQPRKINISKALGSSTYYTAEHQISVAKYAPVDPISLYRKVTATVSATPTTTTFNVPIGTAITKGMTVISDDIPGSEYVIVSDYNAITGLVTLYKAPTLAIATNDVLTFLISTMSNKSDIPSWPGDPAFLEDRYVRFSYRFKYDDNEYSLMAPFTQIAYVPKQKGFFIDGNETDAYRSTVINWFENNINNIDLIIPLPDKVSNLTNNYKVQEIDILYKESDSLAVKVFETIPVSSINTEINSNNNYYVQPYQSQKPYKTLPEDQTTRVYDKVPVRAKAQESAGNRIIYGNYYDKYTSLSSINYNISVQPKSDVGSSFIEYPNHTLKKNRNYQVGFIIADKFGRQSPVILSSVDLTGSLIGDGTYTKGSTVYSSYENTTLFENVRSWFGDALILYLNSPIDQLRDIPAGQPGLYAIPTSNSGFAITASTITDTTYTFTLDPPAVGGSNTIPVIGDIMRGFYTDYVTVTNVQVSPIIIPPTPLPNPPSGSYIVTTSGRVSDIYKYVPQIGGVKDVKFSYEYNPIGWYSYKIVVKQQEQDYYNVYLPGMLNGYPKNQTSGSQVVYTDPTASFSATTTATWTSGNTTITISGSTSSYKVGDYVSGIIPGVNTTIVTILSASSFIISNTPAANGTSQPITVFRAPEGQTSVLNNGINITQFPVSETGNTSHIVLINDNINKVPRDLSEVGPDQKQYRSSIQLYGRVQNTKQTFTITGASPTYSSKTITLTYSTSTVGNEDWILIKPGDGIQCTEANTPVDDITPPATNGAKKPNQYRWLGNTVVVSNTVVGTNGTIVISSPNWVLTAAQNPITSGPGSGDYKTFNITRAENVQYFPTRKADTVISIAYADEFNFIDNSENNLSGTAGLNFYQLQNKPLIGRVSTVNEIGVTASDMIPFLSVYETRPDESLLEIFWETATTGLISDLNADVSTGFSGPTGFADLEYLHFENQDPNGLDFNVNNFGQSDSRYITSQFVPVGQQGFPFANTEVTLLSVIDGANNNRTSEFGIESGTSGGNDVYRLKINYIPTNDSNPFVFNHTAGVLQKFVFSLFVKNIAEPETATTLTIEGRLSNIAPTITTSVTNYSILQTTTTITTLEAKNGSFQIASSPIPSYAKSDLKWSIVSGNSGGYFEIEPYTGVLKLINPLVPLSTYSLVIRVEDAINTTNGDTLSPEGTTFGTLYNDKAFTINVGDAPMPIWLRPDFESQTIYGGNTCGTPDTLSSGMIYIGPNATPNSSYVPVIPGSSSYQFIENVEVENAEDYGVSTIVPEGLNQGEYRVKVQFQVDPPGICPPRTFATARGRAQIYLYKRKYTSPPSFAWELVSNENNWGGVSNPYRIGPLSVGSLEIDGGISSGPPQALLTSFTIEAEEELHEYAIGVNILNLGTNVNGSPLSVVFFGNDANYSYPQIAQPFLPAETNDYSYYTGVEQLVGNYPSGVPYESQDAIRGISYNSSTNAIASGNVNAGNLTVSLVLTTPNYQIAKGLKTTLSGAAGTGTITNVNPTNPAEITLQLDTTPSTSYSLIGGNLAVTTVEANEGLGRLYVNTEEGTEIKRFYTNAAFTQKWIPPVAGKFYNFITTKDYNPQDIVFTTGPDTGTYKYSKYPFYCARVNADGEVMPQTAPTPNVQTAWLGQNTVNTESTGFINYNYNVYYTSPVTP